MYPVPIFVQSELIIGYDAAHAEEPFCRIVSVGRYYAVKMRKYGGITRNIVSVVCRLALRYCGRPANLPKTAVIQSAMS